MRFNEVLKYKEICEELNDNKVKSGRNRDLQLNRWRKKYEVVKVDRGKYIIKRELTEKEKEERQTNTTDYKQTLQEFEEKRYIKVLTDLADVKSLDKVEYECEFHKGIIQKSKAFNLIHSIGCPLCYYPMSRFEVMLYLGLEGSLHRNKINGVEYDILLPKDKIAIEVDGMYFHSDPSEPEREALKYSTAEEAGYKLIKIYECFNDGTTTIHREGDKIYTTPYTSANKKDKDKIIKTIQEVLPYKHLEENWDKAADYMRKWKKDTYEHENKHICQYDEDGKFIYEYKNFDEIKKLISNGNAFGFRWEIKN